MYPVVSRIDRVLAVLVLCLPLSLRAQTSVSPPAEPEPERQPFAEFVAGVREDALARGLRVSTLDAAFASIEPVESVIQRDRTQTEYALPLDTYVKRRVSAATVRIARARLRANRAVLSRVSAKYGVDPSALVAVWGLESNFGRFAGVRPTIPVLATLAWEGRRSAFFRTQLLAALEIVDRGDIELARLRGSWAGALGQVQFMPTSYLEYAVDFDGDGRRDIWDTPGDVFASIANYLVKSGWTRGERWGREVIVSDQSAARIATKVAQRMTGCRATREMTSPEPLSTWKDLGVRLPGGRSLPSGAMPASLVRGGSRSFLVYRNYEAILAYNCAHSYALSVGILADRIR
jgi:membrane-bound lytic murein transglycosylase B